MGCASFFISTTLSIKKPHYTLNDTNIGPLHCLCKCIFYALNSHNPCIKIIGGSAAYHPVKGWVNIIRTCLKGLDSKTPFFQGSHKPYSNGCLTDSTRFPCNYE